MKSTKIIRDKDEISYQLLIQKTRNGKAILKRIKKDKYLLFMLIPVFTFFLLFRYLPMYGLVIIFKNYNMFKGVAGSPWVGLDNFRRIFSTTDFFRVLRNTLTLNFLSLITGFSGPIILALLLNEIRNIIYKRSIQTLVYLPHFLSWVVVANLFIPIFSGAGVINALITSFGGSSIPFLTKPSLWILFYLGSGIWKGIGWGTIIYLAAISGIDPCLYEASIIDGASRWRQTLHITLPCLAPTIIVLLLLRIGNMMNIGFEQPWLLKNSLVINVAEVISTYVYRVGLERADISRSATIGFFQSFVNMIMLLSANKISKKMTDSSII